MKGMSGSLDGTKVMSWREIHNHACVTLIRAIE